MILKKGDMFGLALETSDLFLVTGNSYVTKDGRLVMGRGAARQLRDEFPGIDKEFGSHITHLDRYSLAIITRDEYTLGMFQVKYHWRDKAVLDLIERSCYALRNLMVNDKFHSCDLNFPGIGNGGLKREQVLPILEKWFSDLNVYIWEYDNAHP